MRWAVASSCLAMFAACTPAQQGDQAVERQPLLFSVPDLTGASLTGARLGTTLAPCPGTGYVAGAPGNGSAFLSRSGLLVPASGNSLGLAVSCDGTPTLPRMLAASNLGAAFEVDGGWHYFTSSAVSGLATSETAGLPLLVAQNGTVRFLDPTTWVDEADPLDGGLSSFGSALAWFPTGNRFVVGAPDAGRVLLYDYSPGGSATLVRSFAKPVAGFGRAVAVGDVSARPGLEIIVGAQSNVFVYQQDGTLVLQLPGVDPTFGTSLAIEKEAYFGAPPIDAIWVGEPGLNQVHSFIGTLDTVSNYSGTVRFGASLSIDPANKLSVGAPGYPNATEQYGAVFTTQLSPVILFGGAIECSGASCVSAACELGDCVGGVYCRTTAMPISRCSTNDVCNAGLCIMEDGGIRNPPPDAGGADAGTIDGGSSIEVDAGAVDAGAVDAGAVDAGAVDAGAVDAGVVDAGVVDAGEVDAGEVDAGVVDAGGDAGAPPDAGSGDGGVDPNAMVVFSTCGCDGGVAVPMLLLGLVVARRRTRR